jgi:hypothetical protein
MREGSAGVVGRRPYVQRIRILHREKDISSLSWQDLSPASYANIHSRPRLPHETTNQPQTPIAENNLCREVQISFADKHFPEN